MKASGSISLPVVLMGTGFGEGLGTGPGDGLEVCGNWCCTAGSLGGGWTAALKKNATS